MSDNASPSSSWWASLGKICLRIIAIDAGLATVLVVVSILSGWRSLDSIGSTLFYAGIGLTAVSAAINFNRSGTKLRHDEPYEKWQARKVDTTEDWAMLTMIASTLLAISGFSLMHWAACGRLYCG